MAILVNKNCTTCIRQVVFEADGRAIICCCDDATIWRYDISELDIESGEFSHNPN